jgi:hypothetical protein
MSDHEEVVDSVPASMPAADEAPSVVALQHKERGNALFKKGLYGSAIEAYTAAIGMSLCVCVSVCLCVYVCVLKAYIIT